MGSLTNVQKSLITGTLLGDGYLRMFPGRKDALLEINHSFHQRDYVDWKYNTLQNVAGAVPKLRNGNGARKAYRFYTKQRPELTTLWKSFYMKGVNVISDDLILDPMVMAVWFMDDGSRCRASDFYLNTQQYNLDDQKRLMYKLRSIGLEVRLNKDKSYWRLRFLKSSIPRLKELISDLIIPSMRYKMDGVITP